MVDDLKPSKKSMPSRAAAGDPASTGPISRPAPSAPPRPRTNGPPPPPRRAGVGSDPANPRPSARPPPLPVDPPPAAAAGTQRSASRSTPPPLPLEAPPASEAGLALDWFKSESAPSDVARAEPRRSTRAAATNGPAAKPAPKAAAEDARTNASLPEELGSRSEQAAALVAACELELAQKPVMARRGRLHYECAKLYECELGDASKAATHYLAAREYWPEHLPSIQGARRALMRAGEFKQALPLFDAEQRAWSEPQQKARVLLEKARLLSEKLGREREALDAYETALELDDSNATVLRAALGAELGAKAWGALDRTYERAASAITGDPRHRAALLSERARLVESRKQDSLTATELYQAALDADEACPTALYALKRLHSAHQRWHDLVQVLEREAALAFDPAVRAMALYRIGRIHADRLGDLGQSVDALERALAYGTDEPMILEELARVYELGRRYPELVRVLERVAQKSEHSGERIGLYQRLGELFEQRLRDEERAIEWYERALGCDRAHLPAVFALSKLYARRKEWPALIAVHAGEAEATHDSQRRAMAHARIGEILELELGDPEQASVEHARALGMVPGYVTSFKALVRLYSQAGRYRELCELYERGVDVTADPESKIAYLFSAGRLYEDVLGAPAQAAATYRRVLGIDAGHLGAMHATQRAAERAGQYRELVSALELEAQKVSAPQQKVQILSRAAEVCETRLEDDEAAIGFYRQVHALDRAYAPALSGLGRLYAKGGRFEALLETYESELAITPAGPRAAALLYKMGELREERLGRDEAAIASYRKAVDLDASNAQALHALARKFGERGRFEDLAKLLELELEGSTDGALRARIAFRLAELYEHRLKSPDKALLAYERAVAADADFRPARDGWARLLTEGRAFQRLADELAREAETTKDPNLLLAALFREGEIWRDELADPERAIGCFEAILARDPGHIDALLALEALYGERRAFEPLSRVLAAEARVFADTGARVAALRELARLEERHLGAAPEQVQSTYLSILQLLPTDLGALYGLEELALAASDKKLIAHIDATLAPLMHEPSMAALHCARLGAALDEIGDPAALEMFRAALNWDPESLSAARAVVRHAEGSRDPALLEEAAESALLAIQDREQAARLLVRAAHLRADAGDREGAIGVLARALEVCPDHEPAGAQIRELLSRSAEFDRLIAVLSQAALAAKAQERAGYLWASVADLYAEQKHDLPAALAALQRAQNLVPMDVPVLLKLAEFYARDGQWLEAAESLEEAIELEPEEDLLLEAHLRLADVLAEHLGDAGEALSHLRAVLERDPDNRLALERLLSLQKEHGHTEEAAETAQKLLNVSPGTDGRTKALLDLARLEHARGHASAALQAYEQAVELAGVAGTAAAEFRELISADGEGDDQRRSFARYAAALERHLDRVQPAAAAPATQLELARVQADELGELPQAIRTLERGLARTPTSVELLADLAARLLQADEFGKAVEASRRALDLDVNRPDVWRRLSDSFAGMQRPLESALALAPLLVLDAANQPERAMLTEHPPRALPVQAGSFDADDFRNVDVLGPADPASRLLAQISEGLGKVHAPDLDRYAVTAKDRINAKSSNPLRALADRVANVFGVEAYDLYLRRAQSGGVDVEFTDPVTVIVPGYLLDLGEHQQLFALGRVMANIGRKLHAVDRLDSSAMELLLAAAARSVNPNFGAELGAEETLNALAKRVARSLPWLRRSGFEEAARSYADSERVDVARWQFWVRLTAARAALIVSDDLPGSIAALRAIEKTGSDRASSAALTEMVHDLMRFWVSDAAMALRRRLGLL